MKHIVLSIIASLGITTACTAQDTIKTIAPQEFAAAVKTDTSAVVIDVRTDAEYADGHLENAMHIDYLQEESFDKGIAVLDKSKTYYVYCRSGRRSHGAAVKMQAKGLAVVDMKGGYMEWANCGMPTVK